MNRQTFTSFTFLLLIAFSLYSQPVTVVSGKVENIRSNNYTRLTINYFNHETLEAKQIKNSGKFNTDLGSFRLETKDVIQPYQACELKIGGKTIHILLSPGDTLNISADYNYLDAILEFKGNGAGINYYMKDYNLKFWETNVHQNLRKIKNVEDFQKNNISLYNKKLNLLDTYYQQGKLDSNYYSYEVTRIKYSMISQVLLHFINNPNLYKETDYTKGIDSLLVNINNRDPKLLDMWDYRNAMSYLIYYRAVLQNEKNKALIIDQIDCADKYLRGEVQRYVLKRIFNDFSYESKSEIELNVVAKNLKSKIDDPLLEKAIDFKLHDSFKKGDTDLSWAAFSVAIISLCFFFVSWLVSRISIKSSNQVFRLNLARALAIVFYAILLILIFTYLEETSNRRVRYHAVHILFMIGVYIYHTFYMVPKFFYSKKRAYYYGSITIVLVMAIALAQFTRHLAINRAISWSNPFEVSVYAQTWLALTLIISWFGFFMHSALQRRKPLGNTIREKKVNTEIVILTLVLFIINLIFSFNVDSRTNLSEVLTFYLAIAIFLTHTFWLVPKLLFKKQYKKFVIYNIALLLLMGLGTYITTIIQSVRSFYINGLDFELSDLFYFQNTISSDKLLSAVLIIAPAVVYNYIKHLIKTRETEGFRLYRNKEAELMHLRSQVNPHFLFNNLNTLYSFALKEKSEKTAESIAKLANLMRYMIDDMDKESIQLKKEVSYIEDYIKLQSIRSSVKHNITLNVDIDCENECTIAPMLLIPFVENAFKHGINPNKTSELLVDIKGTENEIQFVIENNVDKEFESFYKEKGFGIGIENVKRRLGYIYPNSHNISIAETDNRFIVIISIKQKLI